MDDSDVYVRVAKAADARAIERVLHRAYDQYRDRVRPPLQALSASAADIARDIRTPGRGYLVARVGNEVVGTIRYRRVKHRGTVALELSRLAVDPDYRHGGLGRRLLADAEKLALKAGIFELRGHVRAALSSLLDFYGSLGWRAIGRLSKPGYPRYLVLVSKKLKPPAAGVK